MGAAVAPLMIATTVAGGITSAVGAEQQAGAQAAALNYQAQVAQNNAKIAQQNKTWDIQSGDVAATNQELKTAAVVGQTKADEAASGVDVNTGSFVKARAGEAETGMLDALTIRSDAAKKAYADEVQANNETAQGTLDTMGASKAEEAGDIGAATSLLGGASSAFGDYAKMQKLGVV
jgi:hypothetical protein